MMKALKKKRKGGFTLIELIVVIAILGILAAIAVPRLMGFTNNASSSAEAATLRTVQSAYAIYEAQGTAAETWPSSYIEGVESGTGLTSGSDLIIKNGNTQFTLSYDGTEWSITTP